MGKNRNRNRQGNNNTTVQTHQKDSMTTPSHAEKQAELEQTFSGPGINPEAQATKPQPEVQGAASATPETKEDPKKGGVVELIASVPKSIYNKGILPAYQFCKGVATRAWGWCVDSYNSEVALYKELGATKYFLGRIGKLAIKALKIVGLLAVASMINTFLVNAAGISLFSPTSLMVIAFVALIAIVAKSYMDQKDMGAKFSVSQTGSHIVESVMAA